MLNARLPIPEIRRHCRLIKLDGNTVIDGDSDGLKVIDCLRFCHPLLVGKRPVIAVVGDSQADLFRRYFRQGVLCHASDHIDRGHCHGRAICVSPFIRHQQNPVGRLSEQAVIDSFVKQPPLVSGRLRSQCNAHLIAEQVHHLSHQLYKFCIFHPVLRQYVFKININSAVAFLRHRTPQLPY